MLVCANIHCGRHFHPDPKQPAKKYCGETCRINWNNILILARQGGPKREKWHTVDPESMTHDDWTEMAAFAGGTPEGAENYLAQYVMAGCKKKRRKVRQEDLEPPTHEPEE
jgi:hypothetical protein